MMSNMLMQLLMNQLQRQNPQLFQTMQMARQNNINPTDLFKQITKNYTPQQMTNLFTQAKQYGIPDEVIQQVQR